DRGLYFDPDKLHVLNHKGKYLSVRGPLNIARPIQGWPVIVQAGASEAGRQLAAETAEAVFTAQANLAAGREVYAAVKCRAAQAGRSPKPPENSAGLFRRCRRHGGGGARQALAARQPRALRQRHRLALDRAWPRCLALRSRRAVAGNSRKQRQQERSAARDRACAAREAHR